ncbi:hypothetical protein E8E11_006108 [Didymella keratinophila]|nr:hypothetical protein E8E11_006108 [Didymella keratinophila]
MASRGSTQGIFPRNDQPKSVLPSNATLRAQGSGRAVTIVREEFGEESLKRLDSFGPLSNRGWCLQEAVLSPRHLYFGRDQVYWRCPAGYQAADGTSAGLRIPEYPLPYLSSCIFQGISPSPATTLQNSSLLLEDYNDLVQLYSQRSLTFGSDKLPAFSGVAGRLHDAVAGHYLAGIWSVDIVTALLWEREMSTCKHVVPYRAPSWSWAVTDEPILMNNKSGKIAKNLGPSSMTLLNHMVVPIKVDNPYGEVSSACISVKGLTLPLVRSTQHIGIVEEDYVTGRAYLDEAPPKYHPDAKEPDCSPSIFLVENDDGMYLLTMETGDRTRRHEEFHLDVEEYAPENYMALLVYVAKEAKPLHEAPYPAQGLILKPADTKGGFGDNRYERVGIFKFWQLNGWRIDEWKTKVLELV